MPDFVYFAKACMLNNVLNAKRFVGRVIGVLTPTKFHPPYLSRPLAAAAATAWFVLDAQSFASNAAGKKRSILGCEHRQVTTEVFNYSDSVKLVSFMFELVPTGCYDIVDYCDTIR